MDRLSQPGFQLGHGDRFNALPADLTLRNALGQAVRTLPTEGASDITIDLQGLTRGVYFVEIPVQEALHHQRLLVD